MNRRLILVVLSVVGVAIVAIILIDFLGSKAGKRGSNPYYMNLDEYEKVDPAEILYKEVLKVDLGTLIPCAIDVQGGIIWLAAENAILQISSAGQQLNQWPFSGKPTAIHATQDQLLVSTAKTIQCFDLNGSLLYQALAPGDSSVLTSVTLFKGEVFAADAGERMVHRFSGEGQFISSFAGKRNLDDLHGFIIPSGYMDVAVNMDEELWVANTGMHALENYTEQGTLRGYWEKNEHSTEGFSGCCNPSHFDIFDDGTFVTSEKGIFRIKVYKPSGEYIGVVAAPAALEGAFVPLEVAAGDDERVYALDFNRKQIRIFAKKASE